MIVLLWRIPDVVVPVPAERIRLVSMQVREGFGGQPALRERSDRM